MSGRHQCYDAYLTKTIFMTIQVHQAMGRACLTRQSLDRGLLASFPSPGVFLQPGRGPAAKPGASAEKF